MNIIPKEQRIAAIKRVWKPGDNSRTLAKKLGWPPNTVLTVFYNHRAELQPCELQGTWSTAARKSAQTASFAVKQLFDHIDRSNVTYSKLAEQLGMSKNTLTRWKMGESEPRIMDMEIVARHVGLRLTLEPCDDINE